MEFGLDLPGEAAPRWRVKELRYTLVPQGQSRFAPGLHRVVDLDAFEGRLSPPMAVFVPREEFGNEEEARAVLEPQLEDWRIAVRLRTGEDILPFVFIGSEMECEPPLANGAQTVFAPAPVPGLHYGEPAKRLTLREIPEPLPFETDALTEIGVELLNDVKVLPRHVLKFAWLQLTLFHAHYGPELAIALVVDQAVLDDLADLCSAGAELTLPRRMWAEKLMRELTYRHGQRNAGFAQTLRFSERCPDC